VRIHTHTWMETWSSILLSNSGCRASSMMECKYVTSTDSQHVQEYHNELSIRAPSNGL
jgi:hypothetical protein